MFTPFQQDRLAVGHRQVSTQASCNISSQVCIWLSLWSSPMQTVRKSVKHSSPPDHQLLQKRVTLHFVLGAQGQQWAAEQDKLSCGPTGASSGNCQETETCMVWACHIPWLQNHPSGHIGGWSTQQWEEEMLNWWRLREDTPAHTRIPHNGLLHKRLEEDLC